MVVLQTILFLILVYYAVKLLLKWLAPRLLNYAMKKTEERFGQQFGNGPNFENEGQREGDTSIYKKSNRNSKGTKKVGEYIDFEEID